MKSSKISRPEVAEMFKYGGVRYIEYGPDKSKSLLKVRVELKPGTYTIEEGDGLFLIALESSRKTEDWHEDYYLKLDEPKKDE